MATSVNRPQRNPTKTDNSKADRKKREEPTLIVPEEETQRIQEYFDNCRKRLDVKATTRTRSRQELDWIPIESQTPDGKIASPPPSKGGRIRADRSRRTRALRGKPICPKGYIPRRRQSRRYELDGKVIVDPDIVPERNPASKIADDHEHPNAPNR